MFMSYLLYVSFTFSPFYPSKGHLIIILDINQLELSNFQNYDNGNDNISAALDS